MPKPAHAETRQNRLTINDISKKFADNSLSPVELAQDCLMRIKKINPSLNAFCAIWEDEAIKTAQESEKRWRQGCPKSAIDGIPATIKDLFEVKNRPMRQGSLLMPDIPAQADSPTVANLRKAGAVFLGATTTPEFGHKGVTDSPLTGITRNPWNASKTPGGSSGGSAICAALDLGMIHLGSDGGGSCRIPASFSGVFGYKPTQNTWPVFPASFFYSFSSPGLLAARVADVQTCLPVLRRKGRRDPLQITSAYRKGQMASGKKLKAAYAPTFSGLWVHSDTAKIVKNVALALEEIAEIEEITPEFDTVTEIQGTHWLAGAATIISQFPDEGSRSKMDPSMRFFGEHGEKLPLLKFLAAQQQRLDFRQYCATLFKKYDFLIMPTTPMPAFDTGINAPLYPPTGEIWYDWTPFTFPANMAGLPAASYPAGFTKDSLPVGVQIIAAPMHDLTVLDVCAWLENCFPPHYPAYPSAG